MLEILNREIRKIRKDWRYQDQKKRFINLEPFADDLVLTLRDRLKGIEILLSKLKEFGALAGFKVNKEIQTKMLTKNMKIQE